MRGRRVLLGISGGIAAYKMASLTRLLVRAGAEVRIVMTREARAFISPLTLATLSRNPVMSQLYNRRDGSWTNHVELGCWADLMLIAPATANTLAKMASGASDNLLLTTYLSARCPVWVAPAMDLDMWKHPATQRNLRTLESDGVRVLPPDEGELASGLSGPGRLPEPEALLACVAEALAGEDSSGMPAGADSNLAPDAAAPAGSGSGALPLSGLKALVTAGPTFEPIDPVRYIGNHSSGRMGIAVAEALAARGAEVSLILGPGALQSKAPGVHVVRVTTATEMYEACLSRWPHSAIFVGAAAVADFRPESASDEKIKKEGRESMSLRLVPNPDILAEMGRSKRPDQLVVGFALETEREIENAISKLERKNLDLIVLNSLRDEGAGFGTDTNRITLIGTNRQPDALPLISKVEAGHAIARRIASLLQPVSS
jgi:phosphopantothenoylcysteine decarboxylase/phosphopantothenate--cysteine ligase